MQATILNLEVIENGTHNSLIAGDGRVFATGRTSREMLREAAWIAKKRGFESISIDSQNWEIAKLIED